LGRAIRGEFELKKIFNGYNVFNSSLAIIAYDEAIRLNPNFYEVFSNQSIPLNKLKRFPEASESCIKALEIRPDYVETLSNYGNALQGLKRYDEVIAHYEKAITLKPDYAEA
jgi:tetratricopeptide (TPR) repeat protein